MAYKMFGKGDPLILHNGASDNMDAWDPALLSRLASNNTVIIFDSEEVEILHLVPNRILFSYLVMILLV